jgi:hypothetical protein
MGLKIVRFFSRAYAGGWMCCGILGVWMGALMLVGGCGGTGGYSDYYDPAWMADGRIIAVRDDVKTSNSGFAFSAGGSAEHSFKLVVMNADGSGEHVVKDDASGIFSLNVSPSGNYIACHTGDEIRILDADYHTHSVIYWKEESGESLSNFDWSPDEERLIISTSQARVSIYGRDGTKVKDMDSLSYAYAWKYNWLIVGQLEYVRIVDELENIIVEGNDVVGGGGEQFFPDGNTYLGLQAFGRVNPNTLEVLETYPTLNSIIESVQGGGEQVNPVDAGEVMYTVPVASSYGSRDEIYLIRLDGSNNRRLR